MQGPSFLGREEHYCVVRATPIGLGDIAQQGSYGTSLAEVSCGLTDSAQSTDDEWARPVTTSAATQRHYTAVTEAVILAHERNVFNLQNAPSSTHLAPQRSSETESRTDKPASTASSARLQSLAPTTARATTRSGLSPIEATAPKSMIPIERGEKCLDGDEVVGCAGGDDETVIKSALTSPPALGRARLCGDQGRLRTDEESAEVWQTLAKKLEKRCICCHVIANTQEKYPRLLLTASHEYLSACCAY